ncbi:MAG TPA: DUF1152 domain-containing protein [Methylomirabilota bacterium]|jgi:hypothetical protein|nr:DUF1152 domain-containing protein [Methylomirabilota bacterium]
MSLEQVIRASTRALVLGVGGGGDVVGALATARFLEFCGLQFHLGGLPWERFVYDPTPGPRSLIEIEQVGRIFNQHAWTVNGHTHTHDQVRFTETEMAALYGWEVVHIDISGGVVGALSGLEAAIAALGVDLLVGIDVGGDSLAYGNEPGLRSPLADAVMLATFVELEKKGYNTLWGVFGYGSDGELTVDEIEHALAKVAAAGGLLGAWALTPQVVSELEDVIEKVPTEASAVPLRCARGAWGSGSIRYDERRVKLTPLTTLTFYLTPSAVFNMVARPARAVAGAHSLEEANDALHRLSIKSELDVERERFAQRKP